MSTVTFTITGSWEKLRLIFSSDPDSMQSFADIPTDGVYTVHATDAEVPSD